MAMLRKSSDRRVGIKTLALQVSKEPAHVIANTASTNFCCLLVLWAYRGIDAPSPHV
jgi:hypothetical protein